MSVINKMLRDLDKRNAANGASSGTASMRSLRKGTASLDSLEPGAESHTKRILLWCGLLLLVLTAAAYFWWTQLDEPQGLTPVTSTPAAPLQATQKPPVPPPITPPPPEQAVPFVALPMAEPAVTPAPVPVPIPAAVPPPAAPASAALPSLTNPKASPAPANTAASAPVKTQTPVPAPSPATKPMATTPLPAAPSADPNQSALRQQQSGREALIQSQALWANGSRDQAIDLLQQAEAAAERNAQSSPSASNTQHLSTLVRELARMLLAQGRAVGALDMLVRVEPQLNGEADIWALRANVAQRLGRHQDSVAAYTVALQSRPTEQRWLLGSAVSFAALGQIAQATDLAEKARLVGTISPEVQTYLRQMGVNLKDQ